MIAAAITAATTLARVPSSSAVVSADSNADRARTRSRCRHEMVEYRVDLMGEEPRRQQPDGHEGEDGAHHDH
jgi:hypothetical protein